LTCLYQDTTNAAAPHDDALPKRLLASNITLTSWLEDSDLNASRSKSAI
jgi:hypothetical protein